MHATTRRREPIHRSSRVWFWMALYALAVLTLAVIATFIQPGGPF